MRHSSVKRKSRRRSSRRVRSEKKYVDASYGPGIFKKLKNDEPKDPLDAVTDDKGRFINVSSKFGGSRIVDYVNDLKDVEEGIVLCFHPECGHCTSYLPLFVSLGVSASYDKKCEKKNSNCLKFYVYDCKKHGEKIPEMVDGFPTILVIKKVSVVHKYEGSRNNFNPQNYFDALVYNNGNCLKIQDDMLKYFN